MNLRALAAEFTGTFALVLAGCGTMLFAGPPSPVANLAVALAFGLAVLAMAYAVGHVSGGHFNPAVTVGLAAGGRFPVAEAPFYIAAQVAGAIVAVAMLSAVLAGAPTGSNVVRLGDMASISNHFGGKGEFSMAAALTVEFAMAAILLIVIMGSTSKRAPVGFAPLAIGFTVVVLHLLALPVTNAALNPARATAPALLAGGRAVAELWLFWAAPLTGAVVGGIIARWANSE